MVAHVTRDSDTTFKVKGQGHQAALLSAALTRKAAAAVSVGTYCYVAFAPRRARRLGAHVGRRGAWAYRVATRTACLCYILLYVRGCDHETDKADRLRSSVEYEGVLSSED